jgi:tetratricopeptide (TPR) repeat protein
MPKPVAGPIPTCPATIGPVGTAQALCALLRKPALGVEGVDHLLATPRGAAKLEAQYDALLKAHYQDPAQRDQIFVALNTFDDSSRARQVAERWVAQAPDSAYANAALGQAYASAGWEARGGLMAAKTSEQQFAEMTRLFKLAVPAYAKALQLNPRLSVACAGLIHIGKQSSDEIQQAALSHCLQVDPDSYYVVRALVSVSEPRWHGTMDTLRQAVAYAQARVDRSPALGAFLGRYVGYPAAMQQNYSTAMLEVNKQAVRLGPDAYRLVDAGYGLFADDKPWEALGYLSQATRFDPSNTDAWIERSRAMKGTCSWKRTPYTMPAWPWHCVRTRHGINTSWAWRC